MLKRDPEHTWGHTTPLGEEYYWGAVGILKALRHDAAIMAKVAGRCADALGAGHKVYANNITGHMPRYELVDDREGNPAFFDSAPLQREEFGVIGEGDVLLTVQVNQSVRRARDAGAYVVVFTTPYVNNRNTPEGLVRPNEDDLMPEDVATVVVETHSPWEHGLVHVPQVPEMAVCPGSTIGSCGSHWMIAAEVAHAMATGLEPDGETARRYTDVLLGRLGDFYNEDLERANDVAVVIARQIIAGGHFRVQSQNEGVESDASSVAQGLMLTNAFDPRPAAKGGDRDTTLIAAVNADEPRELERADEAHNNGNFVIGIGPPNSAELPHRCDVWFDNRCEEDAGVISIPGRKDAVCPATGIVNLVIMYVITAQFIDEMCRRGAVPYFWMGAHRVLGMDYINLMQAFFKERGY